MVTVSQLHLAGAASATLNAACAPRRTLSYRASLEPARGLSKLGIRKDVVPRRVFARVSGNGDVEVAKNGDGMAKEKGDGSSRLPFKGGEILASAAVFLQTSLPAHALVKEEIEEMMRFSPDEWINIYLTTGAAAVLYLFVIPLVIMNYLRLRWYNRTFLETYFQFMLVFLFFPGLLLLAPFVNFRRLPNDGSDKPW
ncbi:uncharacterized protein [Physcomitrium patens]|uniref:NAD(P)H-quinone oxidoreductase subunit L, chloroplastic n=1 Tax=Physcomitrium patens TaxID=3218 RepID=A0A2K1IH93_PHYPA|nr:uncharacterized protein LOC112276672 [Physcomitrium patens]PNR28645.1 hypothetical protein PHYPA_029238 [Physcomitrium patens]|eukprot:XP_024363968.1 uncharacterized protein LOC112276672 [Physcomitrella patens]